MDDLGWSIMIWNINYGFEKFGLKVLRCVKY